MPLYQVQHSSPLSQDQQDKLAAKITEIHTEKFTTLSLFVNVTFTDISSQPTYVAGKRVRPHSLSLSLCFLVRESLILPPPPPPHQSTSNRIQAHVRHGPARTQDDYNALCSSIQSAWYEIMENRAGANWALYQLHTIFILGDIVAGYEFGMTIPPAGQDRDWMKDNMSTFQQRARDEGEPFVGAMRESMKRMDLEEEGML